MGVSVSPSLQCCTSPSRHLGKEGSHRPERGQLGRCSSAVRSGHQAPCLGLGLT